MMSLWPSAPGPSSEKQQDEYGWKRDCNHFKNKLFVSYLFIYSLQIQAEKGLPTAEEAYNFFTFNFEPEPQDGTEKISRKSKKTKGTAEEDRDDDEEGGEEVERENADVDEDNQDENEDQVRQQSHCKRCCVYHLFCICSRIRPSRFQMPHTLHPASE